MMTNAVEIQGTLQADGTLVLDQRPDLPPGRVRVTVQSADSPEGAANDAVTVLQRIHAAQARRGHVPRSVEEIDADLADLRDDDERSRMIERIQEETRRQREGRQRPVSE